MKKSADKDSMMIESNDRVANLKKLIFEFADMYARKDIDLQLLQQHIEDGRISILDSDLAFFTSDDEIKGFLWDANALAPSPRAKEVAQKLKVRISHLRGVLEAMYKLPPKELEAFIQVPFLPPSKDTHEPGDLDPYSSGVDHWKRMRNHIFRELAWLETIANNVLIQSLDRKPKRTQRLPVERSRRVKREVIDPKPIQSCYRVYRAIKEILEPLKLDCSKAALLTLTINVWSIYRHDLEMDLEALKRVLDSRNWT